MGSFKSDGKFIYLEDAHMEFYVPMEYFDPTKHFAQDFSSYINVLGIFPVGIFKNGKIAEYKTMKHPYMIKVYCYDNDVQTITIPKIGDIRCKVIAFNKGQKIMDAVHVEDSVDGLMFLNMILDGKIPATCPYDQVYQLWHKNKVMNGIDYGVRAEVEEMILALMYRNKYNLSEKFATVYGASKTVDPYEYKMVNVRQVCQYASTFSGITFEDFDTMVTTSINRSRNKTPEMYAPIEDTIKM